MKPTVLTFSRGIQINIHVIITFYSYQKRTCKNICSSLKCVSNFKQKVTHTISVVRLLLEINHLYTIQCSNLSWLRVESIESRFDIHDQLDNINNSSVQHATKMKSMLVSLTPTCTCLSIQWTKYFKSLHGDIETGRLIMGQRWPPGVSYMGRAL